MLGDGWGPTGELVETRFPLQTEGRYGESLVESLAASGAEASVQPPDSGAQTTDRHTASTHCLDTNHIICPPAQAATNPSLPPCDERVTPGRCAPHVGRCIIRFSSENVERGTRPPGPGRLTNLGA
jgi:hypothetical protein